VLADYKLTFEMTDSANEIRVEICLAKLAITDVKIYGLRSSFRVRLRHRDRVGDSSRDES